MSTPLVSVIMGTYNGTAYVLPAITSILKQTFRNFELLLVDDCSTDNVGELIAGFLQKHPDSRVHVLPRQEVNQGCAGTMNNLFAAASGKYIVVMDHDDISLPHRIERAVSFLESHPDMDGCGTSHVILRSGLSNDLRIWLQKKMGSYYGPEEVAASALFNCLFYNPTTCVHRRVLELTPTWRDANQSTGADDEWFERLIAAGARFAVLPEPAILYRRIGSSNSRRFGELTRQFRVRLRCRAVKRLLPDATEQELAIHGRVVARDPSLCREDLPDVRAWFERLLAADMSQVHYGKKELNWILGVNWQRACALVACHDLGAAVHAYCSFDALAANRRIWPLLYEFQKRKIYQISHHKKQK